MNEALRKVLTTTDLDALLDAMHELTPDDVDRDTVVRVLERWEDEQAVANLLFYPFLVPEELRRAVVRRALRDAPDGSYYRLAMSVGLQWLEADELSTDEVREIRDLLFDAVERDTSIVAGRASVSLANFVDAADATRMAALLDHPADAVRHNALAWLIGNVADGDPKPVADLIGRCGLSEERRDEALEKLERHAAITRSGGVSVIGSPLFGYIPNLGDWRRDPSGGGDRGPGSPPT